MPVIHRAGPFPTVTSLRIREAPLDVVWEVLDVQTSTTAEQATNLNCPALTAVQKQDIADWPTVIGELFIQFRTRDNKFDPDPGRLAVSTITGDQSGQVLTLDGSLLYCDDSDIVTLEHYTSWYAIPGATTGGHLNPAFSQESHFAILSEEQGATPFSQAAVYILGTTVNPGWIIGESVTITPGTP